MDEDQILSSIIADPDLVDPSIDVSKLRQTTETNPRLLAEVPEFSGLKFDPSKESYIEDLYSIYGGGLPQSEILQDPTTMIPQTPVIDTSIDAGGGGGGNGGDGIITPDTTIRDQLIDEGIQAAEDDKGDMMLDEGVPVGEAYPPIDTLSFDDQYQEIEDIPIVPIDTVDYSELDDLEADLGAQPIKDFESEQQNLIDLAFSKVGSTANDVMNDLSKIPGAVVDFVNQTVDIAGKKINVGATLLKAGVNKIVGGPITLVFDALGSIKPDKYNEEAEEALGEIGMLKTTAGGLTVDKYNKNVQSIAGDYDDYNLERQIDLQKKIDDGTIQQYDEDGNLTYLGQELEDRKEIEQKLNETRLEEAQQEQKDYVQEIETQPAVDTTTERGRDEADRQKRETGVATIETDYGTRYESSGGVFASAEEAAEKGDGPSGGGGKIVCTMMNDSYGFGSFRNKIWLRHSKDLAPEYQIGYHKIFLPLVRLSKTNKLLKKTLEHIAVHRTIDIRQEARGKKHLLGRVYRKILEPICYWVGKYAKR
jgi:hypothetical protein